MRIALISFVSVAAIAATPLPQVRETAKETLAEAGAYAAACRTGTEYQINPELVGRIIQGTNIVPAEVPEIGTRAIERTREFLGNDQTIVCRDMLERYGPEGFIVENLVIPLSH